MNTEKFASKERDRLQKELAAIGSPYWFAKKSGKRILRTVALVYALHAGFQGYNLSQTEGYAARKTLIESGISMGKQLQDDTYLQSGVQLYLEAKAFSNQEFAQELNTFQQAQQVVKRTKTTFSDNVRRIYDPFGWSK